MNFKEFQGNQVYGDDMGRRNDLGVLIKTSPNLEEEGLLCPLFFLLNALYAHL